MKFNSYDIQVRPSKKKCSGSQTMDFKKRARQVGFFFFFYFQSNMGRVFIFWFFFQRFKNITQTSSILLFWQTNNATVIVLSTSRIVHRTICLERNCTLKLTRTVFSLLAMLKFLLLFLIDQSFNYFHFRLISHSNVCQNLSTSPARLKT